jgi:hypothetical protein
MAYGAGEATVGGLVENQVDPPEGFIQIVPR